MAWSVPHDFLPGEMFTHTLGNAIRDQLKESAPAKASAAGYLYASAANALGIATFSGHAGQTLKASPFVSIMAFGGYAWRQAPIEASLTGQNMSTTATDVLSASITTTGGTVVILAYVWAVEALTGASPGLEHVMTLRRDTTDLRTRTLTQYYYPDNHTLSNQVALLWAETPAAGTYVYKVRTNYVNHATDTTAMPGGPLVTAYIHLWEI